MNERIHKELKRISEKMQAEKNPDFVVIMEAMCEIEDLQAKFDTIQKSYTELVKEYNTLTGETI